MQLYKVHGGTEQDLLERKYNIGVGISLGNKWFTTENSIELTKWALEHTKECVVVCVADSINAINMEVRNKISPERAMRSSLAKGKKILDEVEAHIQSISTPDEMQKIHFARWDDFHTEYYKEKTAYLHAQYKENKDFADTIHTMVRNFTSKETRTFSDDEINKLGMYLLEELPELASVTTINGVTCDAHAYPFDGEFLQFIGQLQRGEVFPEIGTKIIDLRPKVFLEVR